MMLPLYLPQQMADRIRSAAQDAYPNEACGILIGRDVESIQGRRIFDLVPAQNVWAQAEERTHRFLIDPLQQMRVERESEQVGLRVVGFYHSHPDADPVPSGFDVEAAWGYYSYLIVHTSAQGAGEMRSWVLDESSQRRFVEQQVIEI